jgi:hypothetical protein
MPRNSSLDSISAVSEPMLRRLIREEVQAAVSAAMKTSPVGTERMAMTLKQAAAATGFSLTRLKDDAARGVLKTIKRGKARVVTSEDLQAYLAAGTGD